MVKIVVSAWVIWVINITLMETTVPEAIYQPLENITIISLMVIVTGGHVLTFQAIRNNNRRSLMLPTTLNKRSSLKERKKRLKTWHCTHWRRYCPFFLF